ncbi:MAG: 3-hydroxyacyl-ACP dehydratase [Vibrio sp.]
MAIKRKPTLLSITFNPAVSLPDVEATLLLRTDHDILDFCGHFTHFPLLPGVTQIDWAVFYAQDLLHTPSSFQGMELIKFQEPIRPDTEVVLHLKWDAQKQKLHFAYHSERGGQLIAHSSGKVQLADSTTNNHLH